MYFKIVLISCLFLPFLLSAQGNFDRQLQRTQGQLNTLKKDIESIKNKISKVNKSEVSVIDQLALIDKQAALVARSKGLLEKENRILLNKIGDTNIRLNNARQRQKELQELYAQRAIYAYKHGKIRDVELLLTSTSLNQAYIRYRYLKQIAEHDARTIVSITKKRDKIEKLKASLKEDLKRKRQNLVAKRDQERVYVSRKKEKAALLKKIRWNQSSFTKQLSLKENQKENLIAMIIELERKRQLTLKETGKPDVIDFKFDDFRKAKGKLPWPVKGKVVTRYGKQRDKLSKTYTKNTDIEIKSVLGTEVRCVFKGVARVITYMPGYGNTLIVDHGKGYYSVYAHLDEIYVQQDEGIATNQVIATVGDSGSLAGAKLQFGIYGKQETYNPESWLR